MRRKIGKVKATFSLTETLVAKLHKDADEHGMDMSTIVILALQDYYRKKEKRSA